MSNLENEKNMIVCAGRAGADKIFDRVRRKFGIENVVHILDDYMTITESTDQEVENRKVFILEPNSVISWGNIISIIAIHQDAKFYIFGEPKENEWNEILDMHPFIDRGNIKSTQKSLAIISNEELMELFIKIKKDLLESNNT